MSHDKEFYGTFIAVMAGLAILAVILVYTAISLTSDVSQYKPEEIVIENIKPVGEVYIAGESAPPAAAATSGVATMVAAATEPAAAKSGEQIYNASCMACHATGAAGAPKLGDATAWAPRIAKGMSVLLDNAIKGINAMPPKGLCMSCSDADLQAAIDYIVVKSR
ncbi:MAG: c-type cytochrome [Gammaproteobacteria bacterium]